MFEDSRISRRSAVAALIAAGIGTACRGGSDANPPPQSLDDLAERYVRLTLELAQHQPSLVESWRGPVRWLPGPRRPVAAIHAEIVEADSAVAQIATGAEPNERMHYLRQQLEALSVAARRLSGESMTFLEEARASLGSDAAAMVDRLSADADGSALPPIDGAHDDLERLLPGSGPLHERYAAFRLRHAIAPTRVVPALRSALESCRRRVRSHLALPTSEAAAIESAVGLGLEGRATYVGDFRTRVLIDTSGPIDLARLVWLVAHESYPGHHVQHVLADRDLVRGRGWQERALHPSFGRHLLYGEGAAEAGAALLLDSDAFEDVCQELAPVAGVQPDDIAAMVAVHRAVSALDIAIAAIAGAYLDGEGGSEAAAEELTTRALVADADRLIFVIERQRTRLLAYPVGRRLVRAQVFAAPAERRWERLARIATTLTLEGMLG